MTLTREVTAGELLAYLGARASCPRRHHETALADLVDWAETAMMEGDFEEAHYDAVRDAVARLGLADVRAFGLTWEDCESLLRHLGYKAQVEIIAA